MSATAALGEAPSLALDPFSAAFFDDPFPSHAALRDAGPVVFLPSIGAFAVARHEAVTAVLKDHGTFCSSRGVGLADFATEEPWRPPSLVLERDPPEHTRFRRVLDKVLGPAAVKALRPRMQAQADALVRAALAKREVDGVADLAEAFPSAIFPDAMGLPEEGRHHLLAYASLAFNAFGPDNEFRRRALAEAGPHVAWVTERCRREHLRPGGIGHAIHEAADRGEIAPEEAVLLVRSLLTAGLDTTLHSLAAALHALAHHPAEHAKLRADPTLARAAFEEAIRLESPVQTFFRTTTREAEVGGVHIPEGRKVLMFLGAANRDPRRWEQPDRLDITRRLAGHVGFGGGVHMCVGQLLARLEGEALLSALARQVTRIEPAGPASRIHNNTLRGLHSLPLRLS
ncbi:MAG: cytochrome P450 [Acetobacteraceae bacterium]|nr:cytochrome P450 [Acetobacteraceae bacterium]